MEEMSANIYEIVEPFTGTGPVRVDALITAVKHVVEENIPGDFVECGVWKGGSIMAMALTLIELGAERDIWLYDTFAGMPPPQGIDGKKAARRWAETREDNNWCLCPIEEVKENVYSTGYPRGRFRFVKGMVEDIIPMTAPEKIALLRLDTDWYSSTLHELIHLYPRLSLGGVLLIDDYGHYRGARKATDRFIADHAPDLVLQYVDKTCRMAIKGGKMTSAKFYKGRKKKHGVYLKGAKCLDDLWGPFKSVLDLGGGDGYWASVLSESGAEAHMVELSEAALYYACKGVECRIHDLREPLDYSRTFELVLCIEVAEHLPESAAGILCDTIARHTGRLLVFTAAPPGQMGDGHMNLQPQDYWMAKLRRRGLVYKRGKTKRLRAAWNRVLGKGYKHLATNLQVWGR